MNISTPCGGTPRCAAAKRAWRAAEAFVQHRGHAYPRNDLLAELFPT